MTGGRTVLFLVAGFVALAAFWVVAARAKRADREAERLRRRRAGQDPDLGGRGGWWSGGSSGGGNKCGGGPSCGGGG